MTKNSSSGGSQLSESSQSLAIEASEIGIWDYSAESNQLIWSTRLEELYGLKPGSFRGTNEHYQGLLHPEDRHFVNRTVDAAIAKRKPYSVMHRVIWPDGSIHWLQGKGKAYFDDNGNLLRITGVTMSIDDRKRAESELKRAIQSRDEFLSIASHELKTPLTALMLQTNLVKRLSDKNPTFQFGPDRIRKIVEQMDQQVTRLARLVEDMLDASRVGTGKFRFLFEPVNLTELLADVSARFAVQFQNSKIRFHLDVPKGLQLEGDVYRLEQVISHLYANVIRYASGSTLETRARPVSDETQGMIEIRVRDTGPGISEDAQTKIFARFEGAEHRMQATGLGLGLYLSKKIVDGHQGRITVESALGQGATFVIRLPEKQS